MPSRVNSVDGAGGGGPEARPERPSPVHTHDGPTAQRAVLYCVAPTDTRGGPPVAAALAQWRRVEAELSPILGAAGFAASFRRSVHQLLDTHPALAAVIEDSRAVSDFEALGNALATLSQADADTTHRALMQIFNDLLVGLIGASLSERLLRPAMAISHSGSAGQDTTS